MPAGVPPTSRPQKGPSSSPSMPMRGKAPPPVNRPAPPNRAVDVTPSAAAAPIPPSSIAPPPQHRPKYLPQPMSATSVPLVPPRQRPSVSRATERLAEPTGESTATAENGNEFWRFPAPDVVPASLYPAGDPEPSFYVETAADLVEPADDTRFVRQSTEDLSGARTADGAYGAVVPRTSFAGFDAAGPSPALASVTVSRIADEEPLATAALPRVASSDERKTAESFVQPLLSVGSIRPAPPPPAAEAPTAKGTSMEEDATTVPKGVQSLVVNDEDDDDDAFFVSSRSAVNVKGPMVEDATSSSPSLLEPRSAAAAPAARSLHSILQETPQSLRRMLSDGDAEGAGPEYIIASQEHHESGGASNEPAATKQGEAAPPLPPNNQRSSSGTRVVDLDGRRAVVQPEMDFTVDPIDTWFEKEERQRQKDRERAAQRQKTVRLSEETLKRLSQPRKTAVCSSAAPSSVPVVSQSTTGGGGDDGVVAPLGAVPVGEHADPNRVPPAGGAEGPPRSEMHWAPSAAAERPNETHYFIDVGVFHQLHRLALAKRTTLASIAEALRLFEIGGVLTKGATKLSWESTPLSLGLQPGVQHATALRFVSTLELEEELRRRALRAEAVSWIAHRLAFSEWILRCSDQISRHVFFDATGEFVDVS